MINGMMCSWADVVVVIAGVPITGITAIDYSDEQEVENKYGAGRYPIGRAKGRITPSAKITLYKEEVDTIEAQSVNGRIQDIAPFDVIVQYIPDSGVLVTDKIRNCSFKANNRSLKEGDNATEVELDLIPSHIEWNK